jgi:hypothetical protein
LAYNAPGLLDRNTFVKAQCLSQSLSDFHDLEIRFINYGILITALANLGFTPFNVIKLAHDCYLDRQFLIGLKDLFITHIFVLNTVNYIR